MQVGVDDGIFFKENRCLPQNILPFEMKNLPVSHLK